MRFTAVNKHFCSPQAINYSLSKFIMEWKSKFQLDVIENQVVFPPPFFSIQFHGPPEIYSWGFVNPRLRTGGWQWPRRV